MKILEKKDNQLIFKAEIEDSLANAVRRYVNEIPILAIDEIEIFKNDSPLYDETVAHRMGLIPLKTDKSMNEKTEIELKLISNKEGFVHSGELKGKVEVVYPGIPITSLNKGQELEISAIAKLGKGSEHAKFSPGIMFYRVASEILLDKDLLNEIKKIYPNLEIKEKGNKILIIDDKKQEVADICEGICEERDKKAEVTPLKEVVINIESFGQIEASEILKKSVDELKKDLKEISKVVEKI